MPDSTLLQVKNVRKSFYHEQSTLFKKKTHPVLNGVSFSLKQGECLGIIGESGSGKSTLGRVVLGLEKPDSGDVLFDGRSLYPSGGFWSGRFSAQNRRIKRDISAVFQDYTSSVNPHLTVAEIIAEPIYVHEPMSKAQLCEKAAELLKTVGLSGDYLKHYPHQLSGGQLQRVCIARAIACRPRFILLDEAVSSLDVSIQVQILDLLLQLQQDLNLSYLFITHDLTVVTYLCQRVCFFESGKIIEEIDPVSRLGEVKHEYSKRLLNAVMDF